MVEIIGFFTRSRLEYPFEKGASMSRTPTFEKGSPRKSIEVGKKLPSITDEIVANDEEEGEEANSPVIDTDW